MLIYGEYDKNKDIARHIKNTRNERKAVKKKW